MITLAIDRDAIDKAGFCFRIEGRVAFFRTEEATSEVTVETDGENLFLFTERCGNARAIVAALGAA